ncbi:MAG: acylphosphatase [Pseudomonadota bacterium]
MERNRFRVIVSGRVQGVSFRAYAAEEATLLGLVGWVRNLSDGTVEIEAEGPVASLEQMLSWCRRGSPGARVKDVSVVWLAPTEADKTFRIRY